MEILKGKQLKALTPVEKARNASSNPLVDAIRELSATNEPFAVPFSERSEARGLALTAHRAARYVGTAVVADTMTRPDGGFAMQVRLATADEAAAQNERRENAKARKVTEAAAQPEQAPQPEEAAA